jgi:hypothetical protein
MIQLICGFISVYERNGYWRFHPTKRLLTVNYTKLPFGLNVILALVFNFTELLFYRAIRIFLV